MLVDGLMPCAFSRNVEANVNVCLVGCGGLVLWLLVRGSTGVGGSCAEGVVEDGASLQLLHSAGFLL